MMRSVENWNRFVTLTQGSTTGQGQKLKSWNSYQKRSEDNQFVLPIVSLN